VLLQPCLVWSSFPVGHHRKTLFRKEECSQFGPEHLYLKISIAFCNWRPNPVTEVFD